MSIAIIGAGATGLSLAYLLAKTGQQVEVFDAAPRAGGLLSTFDVVPGCPLEYFYHHFFTHDAELNWLLTELDLTDDAYFKETSMGFLRDGKVHPFDGPVDALRFKPVPLMGRLRFLASSALLAFRDKYSHRDDASALEWFERWAGPHATDAIWRPMMQIKFGDAAGQVPLAWMAGRLRQRVLSRKQGSEQLGYLTGSLGKLVERFTGKLAELGVTIHLDEGVREVMLDPAGSAGGVRTDQREHRADKVFSTLPTPILADLIEPIRADYAGSLREIEYYGAICTILSLNKQLSPVYWLNVADPGYDFGGVIEQTNFVPPNQYNDAHVVYLSRYLKTTDPFWQLDDKEIKRRQFEQLGRLFDVEIDTMLNQSWVYRGRYAAPVTGLGFPTKIPRFQSPIENMFVASMCHLYPDERSVNNSIRVAAEVARAAGFSQAADLAPTGFSLAGRHGG